MKRFFCIVFYWLMCTCALSSPVLAQNAVKKVAIMEVVDKQGILSYGVKLMLRSSLSEAVTNTPGYEGYDRVDIASIMDEQSFQRTGMVSDDDIKRLGEMTGAAYILIAEAAGLDNKTWLITAKVLNVESAKLEKTTSLTTGITSKELQKSSKKLAGEMFRVETGMVAPDKPEKKNEAKPEGKETIRASKPVKEKTVEPMAKAAKSANGKEKKEFSFTSKLENGLYIEDGVLYDQYGTTSKNRIYDRKGNYMGKNGHVYTLDERKFSAMELREYWRSMYAQYQKACKMQKTGRNLGIAGACIAGVGVIGMAVAYPVMQNKADAYRDAFDYHGWLDSDRKGMEAYGSASELSLIVGGALIGVGGVLTIAGFSMAGSAAKKMKNMYKEHVMDSPATAALTFGVQNFGTGLALKF